MTMECIIVNRIEIILDKLAPSYMFFLKSYYCRKRLNTKKF